MSLETWVDQPFEEWDALDESADGFEAGAFDAWDDDVETPAAMAGDEFEYQPSSHLYVAGGGGLVSGPTALALAGALNPLVADSLDGENVDEFFGRLRRAIGRVGSMVKRGISAVGKVAGPLAKMAGPLLSKALPMIQKVAGFAGPWGRLVSAGIGAAQGLMSGKGLRGALAGALSGAIPGIGGKLASAVLGADGADDDAALDVLADLADTRRVHPAVAFPIGAGLAARVAARSGAGGGVRQTVQAMRPAESWLARLTRFLRGSPGLRLRVMRSIGRLAGSLLARHPQAAAMRGAMVAALRRATRQVLDNLRRQGPRLPRSLTPVAARRRIAARSAVLARAAGGGWGYPDLAAA